LTSSRGTGLSNISDPTHRNKGFASGGGRNSTAASGPRRNPSAATTGDLISSIPVCMYCVNCAFQYKHAHRFSRQSVCPNLDTVREYIDKHGAEAADREFGLDHEYFRITVTGHQQFTTAISTSNGVLGDILLDNTLGRDDFVLLKLVEGRYAGYGINARGEKVPKAVVDRLFNIVNSRDPEVKRTCRIIRSEDQVKDAGLSSADIKRCSNEGCVFNFSAEAFVRICRMHGIPLTSNSAGEAFALQVELEMRKRAFVGAIVAADDAFLELLHASFQGINILECLESMLQEFFETALSARVIRNSFGKDPWRSVIVDMINKWREDKTQEPKETFHECLEAVLLDTDLSVSLSNYIKRSYHKFSSLVHTDKTGHITDASVLKLFRDIFETMCRLNVEMRKFLFTGGEDDPLVSSSELDKYRRVYARALASLRDVRQARQAQLDRITNSSWANCLRDKSTASASSSASSNAESSELDHWGALQAYDPTLFRGIESARELAPDVINELAVVTLDCIRSGDNSGIANAALVANAYIPGHDNSQLVEFKGTVSVLAERYFPEAHNQLNPKVGEKLSEPSEETLKIVSLVRTVDEGNCAKRELDDMDDQKKETEKEIVVNSEDAFRRSDEKDAMKKATQEKMALSIRKHANKIFGLLKDDNSVEELRKEGEEAFVECLSLFVVLAPDSIRDIISEWNNAPSKNKEFVSKIRNSFVAALSGYNYSAATLYQMDGEIKKTINAVHNRREVKTAGTGRRSNGKVVAASDKHAIPSASLISTCLLQSNPAIFKVRSNALSALKKEDRDACILHGYKYKIRETFLENGTEFHQILVFRNREDKMSSTGSCLGGGVRASCIDYVLIDFKSISEDGSTCVPLFMKTPMTFGATTVPIAITRGVKRNGRVMFEEDSGKVSGRNKRSDSKHSSKYGSTECELSKLESFVNVRHESGQILPLVGVVENDLIVEVWSGNESDYHKTVNKILRDNGCLVFGCTEDVPTVYDISMRRKDSKTSNSRSSARFISHSDEDLAMSALELSKMETVLTPQDELKREFKGLNNRDLDEDDVVEKARLEWLKMRIENPVEESESQTRAFIFNTLASKVLFSDNQTRDEIIQALKIGFGEWIHPDEMLAIEMEHEEMIQVIESKKSALLFAFNNNQSLLHKMSVVLDRFYASPAARYEEGEDGDLVVVKPVEVCNNFTPVVEEMSFYKTRNPEHGKKSNGHVSVGGRR